MGQTQLGQQCVTLSTGPRPPVPRLRKNPAVASGEDFLRTNLGDWLEALAAAGPAPGGGSAAAIAGAVAASLVGMTARLSTDGWPEAPGIAVQADLLRGRL